MYRNNWLSSSILRPSIFFGKAEISLGGAAFTAASMKARSDRGIFAYELRLWLMLANSFILMKGLSSPAGLDGSRRGHFIRQSGRVGFVKVNSEFALSPSASRVGVVQVG